ncbi:hypothetical protein U1Q18_027678 [Sarracenia purpurea var. burkii]
MDTEAGKGGGGTDDPSDTVSLVPPDGGHLHLDNRNHHHHHHHQSSRHVKRILLLFMVIVATCLVLYRSVYPFRSLPWYSNSHGHDESSTSEKRVLKLETILEKTAMADKTVIITTLNEAWAAPNSIFDIFLESFRLENNTKKLLNHLVIVALDQKAYDRCATLHPHCYVLNTTGIDFSNEAYFMTTIYLEMMWRRIDFLRSVLQIGYNFIFTDADIMWFRDPFPRFYSDADFQIACDYFYGHPSDLKNLPNGGFNYVKSNNRTIKFYEFWLASRKTYPGLHDQDVLNKIKFDPFLSQIGLKMRFLDTAYFGGFCQPSRDMGQVCTMHANCCVGLEKKIYDLKIMQEDWKRFLSLQNNRKALQTTSWTVPQKCRLSSFRPPDLHKKNVQPGSNN